MKDPAVVRIGRRVLTARRQRGLNANELAEAADVSLDFVVSLEAGRRSPKALLLHRIARALKVRLETLMTD